MENSSSYCLYIEKSYTLNFNSKMKMEKNMKEKHSLKIFNLDVNIKVIQHLVLSSLYVIKRVNFNELVFVFMYLI